MTSKDSRDKLLSVAKKKDQTRSSTGFIYLVLYDLNFKLRSVLLGNSFLQKANQHLCSSENLMGIPIELPT